MREYWKEYLGVVVKYRRTCRGLTSLLKMEFIIFIFEKVKCSGIGFVSGQMAFQAQAWKLPTAPKKSPKVQRDF